MHFFKENKSQRVFTLLKSSRIESVLNDWVIYLLMNKSKDFFGIEISIFFGIGIGMSALVVGNVASLTLAFESFKFFLLKKWVIVVDLPIIYKLNRNYIYFVHYSTSTYCIVV